MFEIVIGLCLAADPTACREVLLPGFESASVETCQANLDRISDHQLIQFSSYKQSSKPKCVETSEIAQFTEISTGVFVHEGRISDAAPDNYGDVSNIGFIIGSDSVAVIDTGGSRKIAEQVYRAIRMKTDLPISHAILTHMHPDHVLGVSVFTDAGAKVVGHAGLGRALQDRSETYLGNFGRLIGPAEFIGTRILPPEITVTDTAEISLGDRILKLQTWPVSHTGTDMTVIDTRSGTLFTGDLLFHRHAPALDGSLTGWRKVLEDMTDLEITKAVPGHGDPSLPWPQGAEALANYLEVLETDTRAAIKQGTSLGEAVNEIGKTEAGNWELFDLFNPRNATVAYTELEWE